MQHDADLTETIADALMGEQGQYREVVVAEDSARVDLVRSCGRAAGRRRGVKVRTLAHPVADGRLEVLVVNLQPIDPDDKLGQRQWQRRLRAGVEAAAAPRSGAEE